MDEWQTAVSVHDGETVQITGELKRPGRLNCRVFPRRNGSGRFCDQLLWVAL